jgi:putative endonuclease
MKEAFFVYIITNSNDGVLYTGVTSDINKRVYEHRSKLVKGFSSKYNLDKLLYYEIADNAESAILREKQIKAGSRKKKADLVNSINPEWKDLYSSL